MVVTLVCSSDMDTKHVRVSSSPLHGGRAIGNLQKIAGKENNLPSQEGHHISGRINRHFLYLLEMLLVWKIEN